MKPGLSLSINPSYHCNFSCDFCYLTPEQLSDRTRLPIEVLEKRLDEALAHYDIEHVDLYGGEPLLLPEAYLEALIAALAERDIRSININTNLSTVPDIVHSRDLHISVSYDFHAREQADRVMMNMIQLTEPFSVLVLASPKVLEVPAATLVNRFNMYSNLESVEIKPYSTNQANQHHVPFTAFEKFVQSIIEVDIVKKFRFINEDLIEEAISGRRNAYSDNHLYITPQGSFAVLEFDLNDNEFFLDMKDIAHYQAWCRKEKARVNDNAFCGSCEFKGRCLSEHLRDVKSLENSCNGFFNLLKWATP